MPSLIILRGLPGSGKSELASVLSRGEDPCFSVDDYFTLNGEYQFNHLENHIAYKQCEENTEKAMKEGRPRIFLHSTFTMEWEIEPYFRLAAQYKYMVYVATVENWHGNGNTHGISEEQLEKMAQKFKVRLM